MTPIIIIITTTILTTIRFQSPELLFSHTTLRFLASACLCYNQPIGKLNRFIVTARHRESPYEIVSLESAISLILNQTHPLSPTLEKVTHCCPLNRRMSG